MTCKSFPTSNEIFILDNKPGSVVHKCVKSGGDRYLCNGSINDGFWKLEKKGGGCRWYKCDKPYDKNGDTDDYSDCIVTNYPYFLKWDDNKCSVNNMFTGNVPEGDCGGGKVCCTEGEVCDKSDCFQYKLLDKYLVSDDLSYKCNEYGCVKVDSGKGDFTNPFCDYQCSSISHPKDYACINGYCQKVANKGSFPSDTKYYDNPF